MQGLCPTAFKGVCRKLGLPRWPYRQNQLAEAKNKPRSASCTPIASVLVEDTAPARVQRAQSSPSKARGREEGRDAYSEALCALLAATGHRFATLMLQS